MEYLYSWYIGDKNKVPLCKKYSPTYCDVWDDIPSGCPCSKYEPVDYDPVYEIVQYYLNEILWRINNFRIYDISDSIATDICEMKDDWEKYKEYSDIVKKRVKEWLDKVFKEVCKNE